MNFSLRCKNTQCPQLSTCERFDTHPEIKEGKVFFTKNPRGPIGCKEFKRKRKNKGFGKDKTEEL